MAVTEVIDNGTITGTVTQTTNCGLISEPVENAPFDVTLIKYIGRGGNIKTPNTKERV